MEKQLDKKMEHDMERKVVLWSKLDAFLGIPCSRVRIRPRRDLEPLGTLKPT